MVSAIGEPGRGQAQLFGITDGFFGPLFFVWLGASLQVRELADHPEFIALGVALGLGAVLAHSCRPAVRPAGDTRGVLSCPARCPGRRPPHWAPSSTCWRRASPRP